ncbi:two-component system, chemotaxis family, response regulator CheB [Paenibacillus sp. UNCCL117]|uniref:chemotaxis protein CheB n=1 Tax=unclassified Paenibacillus TaxID=185978 RepID=UPI0008905F6A|nr:MULTISPECIES: chemotaxis protein CheB [unclassified Paenibacillus]SDC67703.1 two-component system, chemotaxis family, response regulator CheB [Paenibacillus sp. cl123]SFW23396.1 two-component system, chemotaxis family, response regulator CheB [Paenibacillus sp. UNCCL117]
MSYEAVVIGVSAGGLKALGTLLPLLSPRFALPLLIVQHTREGSESFLAEHLNERSSIRVKEADDKEYVLPGCAYLAPPGYHLLVEEDRSLSLSVDPPVLHSRPSIDVLFESAAYVYERHCIGVVLTGASGDGSMGLRRIKRAGGLTVVQNPLTAECGTMPLAAIRTAEPDYILDLEEIAGLLNELGDLPPASGNEKGEHL